MNICPVFNLKTFDIEISTERKYSKISQIFVNHIQNFVPAKYFKQAGTGLAKRLGKMHNVEKHLFGPLDR